METSKSSKITVWITADQAEHLSQVSKQQRREQAAEVKKFQARGMDAKEARVAVMRMRADHWPSLSSIVAAAVERRLDDWDLVGPWEPLTEDERDQLALAGRWPGSRDNNPKLRERNYALPSPLVERLRTASWRVSQPHLEALYERHLVGRGLLLSQDEEAERRELIAKLHSTGRIVRQALARFGPRPADD
jgi:hypothetical protein